MIDAKYLRWIDDNVQEAYGKCAEVTLRMLEAFPELLRVGGYYYCAAWGKRQHWWLKTVSGEIVDPTARQFPSNGFGRYEEIGPGVRVPIGVCAFCGGDRHEEDGMTVCSDQCGNALANSLNRSRRGNGIQEKIQSRGQG